MKKIGLVFLALLMLLALVSCGEEEGEIPSGMKLASDEKNVPYRLCVPEDWQINYGTDGMTSAKGWTMAQSTEGDRSNVVVSYHSNSQITPYKDSIETVKEYYHGNTQYEGMRAKLETLFDKKAEGEGNFVSTFTVEHDEGKDELSTLTVKTKDGGEVAAGQVVYTGTLAGTEVKQVLVMAFYDDYFINITFSVSPVFYDSNRDIFNGILDAFLLK